MDEFVNKRREVFFSNLLLLGFDKSAFEKKYSIPFNKDMFTLPNKKGYEIVTYFLFSKLSAATEKSYNLPWPLVSIEQDRLFQKTCYSHLSSFALEKEVKFPRIVPSLLSLFGGERFYKLYLAFSSYVLKKVIQKNSNNNNLSRPNISQENFNIVKDIVQLSTIAKKDKFVNIVAASHLNDLVWKKYAKKLSECLQKLKQILKTYKESIRSKESIVSSLDFMVPGENLKVEKLVEKSLLLWKPIRGQRKYLEQFFSTEKNLWQCLISEVDENTENSILDGKDIKEDIAILEKLCSDSDKIRIPPPEKDGNVSVIRHMNLLLASLKPIAEILKTNVCNIPETSFLNDGFTLKHELNTIEHIIKKLGEDVIPTLEDNIKVLMLAQSFEQCEETSQIDFNEICPLYNTSYSPEAVKARALVIDPELQEKLQKSISKEIANNSVFSANLSVSQSISDADASITNLSCFHGPNLGINIDFGDVTFARKVALINSFKQKLVSQTDKDSDALSSKQMEVPAESHTSRNVLELSDLDDLDFAPSSHFKMRDSWLNAESLQAETIPDISFED